MNSDNIKIVCAQPGCNRKFKSGSNRRYCFEHKGLSKHDRVKETKRLLAIKRAGRQEHWKEY